MDNPLLRDLQFIEPSIQIYMCSMDGLLSENNSYMSALLCSQCMSILLWLTHLKTVCLPLIILSVIKSWMYNYSCVRIFENIKSDCTPKAESTSPDFSHEIHILSAFFKASLWVLIFYFLDKILYIFHPSNLPEENLTSVLSTPQNWRMSAASG